MMFQTHLEMRAWYTSSDIFEERYHNFLKLSGIYYI